MTTTTTTTARCEFTHYATDFDGSRIHYPCGQPAARRIYFHDEQWGDDSFICCPEHARQALDEIPHEPGATVLGNYPAREALVRFDHDDAGPVYKVMVDDEVLREFGRLDDAAQFALHHNRSLHHDDEEIR